MAACKLDRDAPSLVTVGHEVVVSEPKTAKGRRSVALDPATVAGLKAWRKQQAAERLAWDLPGPTPA